MSIPFFISAFIIPMMGLITDKIGKRGHFLALSSILGLLSFGLFMIIPPITPIILLGLSFSIFAAVVWPSISLVIPHEILVKKIN